MGGITIDIPVFLELVRSSGPVVLLPLMGRLPIPHERVKESPTRALILELVARRPGISLGELRDQVEIGWGAIYHHVHKLERAELVEVRTAGRSRLVFPRGHAEATDAAARALLRGPTARRVARAVLANPGASVRDVVHACGESPRVVYYHLKRFADSQLILSASPTRHFDLSAAPHMERLLCECEQEEARAVSHRATGKH